MKYTTVDVVSPPLAAESSTTTSPERPIMVVLPPVRPVVGIGLPVRDGGPRRRVKGLEQVDREQVLRVLDAAADCHVMSESQWWRASSAPGSSGSPAFDRARAAAQRELGEVA